MPHKRNHNTTNRKRKRIKRVLTPRNRMLRSRVLKNLAYSRKMYKKKRTKSIKRYKKHTTSMKRGGGFTDDDLRLGIITFVKENRKVRDACKDYDVRNMDLKDIKSLPFLMVVYSKLIAKEYISGSTVIVPTKSTDGIHLSISISTPTKGGSSPDHPRTPTFVAPSGVLAHGGEVSSDKKTILNKTLLKYVIHNIREIERNHPHPDLLNTFLYFFDLIDLPSAFAMVSLYLNTLYELTKGKEMTFDQITTYLEKNLAHHSSVEDWQAAFNTITDEKEKKKMLTKYTSVTNRMNMYERANSELNALVSSAWAPFNISNSEHNVVASVDNIESGVKYTPVSKEFAKQLRAKSTSVPKSVAPEIPYTPGKVWWTTDAKEKEKYQVIPNGGNGDCYFLSIAEALNEFNKKHTGFFAFLNKKIEKFIEEHIDSTKYKKNYVNLPKGGGPTTSQRIVNAIPKDTVHSFNYTINGDITVANMRSLLVLYYFSNGFENRYAEAIQTGKNLAGTITDPQLDDINESFKKFNSDVDTENGIRTNVSNILSNTYFAEDASISILQELLWYKTIALSSTQMNGESIIANTSSVEKSKFVVYIMVNYTNNIHYELIKYTEKPQPPTSGTSGTPATSNSTFKLQELPKQIQTIYIGMVNKATDQIDDNVWILNHLDETGLNVSATYYSDTASVNNANTHLLSNKLKIVIKDDFELITKSTS